MHASLDLCAYLKAPHPLFDSATAAISGGAHTRRLPCITCEIALEPRVILYAWRLNVVRFSLIHNSGPLKGRFLRRYLISITHIRTGARETCLILLQ